MLRITPLILALAFGVGCAKEAEPRVISPVLYCAEVFVFICGENAAIDAGEGCRIGGGDTRCDEARDWINNRGRPITTDDLRECLQALDNYLEVNGRTGIAASHWPNVCDHYILPDFSYGP